MAIEPTAENPVRNFPASIHLHDMPCLRQSSLTHLRLQQRSYRVLLGGVVDMAHPLARLLPPYTDDVESAWPKKSQGIGTSTYIRAASHPGSSLVKSRRKAPGIAFTWPLLLQRSRTVEDADC